MYMYTVLFFNVALMDVSENKTVVKTVLKAQKSVFEFNIRLENCFQMVSLQS